MNLITNTTRLVALGALLLCANAATAAMYKWVDEQGRVQYSQTPPPAGGFKELKPGPPPSQSPEEAEQELKTRLQRLDESQKQRDEAKKQKQEEAAQQAKRDVVCEQARKRLEMLQNNPGPRIGIIVNDQVERMSEDERQLALVETQKLIDERCAGAP